MDKVVDSLGLVLEGEHLTAFIPATSKAFVFRVKSRINRGYEKFHYGPLPLVANLPLSSYAGGVILVPATGVMPMYSYTPVGMGLRFPLTGAYDETDMWYLPEDYRERLFHVISEVTPKWLRRDLEIPSGVTQGRFQRDKVTTGIDKLFGYVRGRLETVHFPKLHYGYRFGNDSMFNVYTGIDFTYAEYIIETPKDPELIFNILTRKVPSHWITMPITVYDDSIRRAFVDVYGIEGFTLYPTTKRSEAITEYQALLKEVLV
jgi:hypothetical protein